MQLLVILAKMLRMKIWEEIRTVQVYTLKLVFPLIQINRQNKLSGRLGAVNHKNRTKKAVMKLTVKLKMYLSVIDFGEVAQKRVGAIEELFGVWFNLTTILRRDVLDHDGSGGFFTEL